MWQDLELSVVFEKMHLQMAAQDPCITVIHFAQFEKPFLADAYEKLQQTMPFQILCTHEIAKRLMPNLPTRGLKGLAGYFGFNAGELKRGTSYVEATRCIWKGLVAALETQGVASLTQLENWLAATPKLARKKYEYPLPKEKRLSLPDQPGVYRMISQWGEVLYVGKATSLHSRVNSYFRGQKNRDSRKLEMLTQTWDLQVTPCGSPLESALLETDEIKRLNPRYNISLKTGHRRLVFFNREFTQFSDQQGDEFYLGPFSSLQVFESMMRLGRSLIDDVFDPLMFYEPVDADLLKAGFEIFCRRNGFEPRRFVSLRSILAVGLWWQRQYEIIPDETEIEEEFADLEQTPEDIADRFERHFIRAGQSYARARHLTRLLNADIDFQIVKTKIDQRLVVRHGHIVRDQTLSPLPDVKKPAWAGHTIETYDRMSVLNSELEKVKHQQGSVQISYFK
jgi:DNA polymerase-3 subunit epsilon